MIHVCRSTIGDALSVEKVVKGRKLKLVPSFLELYDPRLLNPDLSTVEITLRNGTRKMDELIYEHCFELSRNIPIFGKERPSLPFTVEEFDVFYSYLLKTKGKAPAEYVMVADFMLPSFDAYYNVEMSESEIERLYDRIGTTVFSKIPDIQEVAVRLYSCIIWEEKPFNDHEVWKHEYFDPAMAMAARECFRVIYNTYYVYRHSDRKPRYSKSFVDFLINRLGKSGYVFQSTMYESHFSSDISADEKVIYIPTLF